MKVFRLPLLSKITTGLALTSLVGGALLWSLLADDSPVVFESAESSASPHGSIYNRVAWSLSRDYDVWVMQQSQTGWSENFERWNRLVIQVDKRTRPYQAYFIQSEPGPLVTRGRIPSLEYGVPCLSCHSNGPRAIRPILSAPSQAPVSTWDRLRIALWNLRIATYGRTQTRESPLSSGLPRQVPLSITEGREHLGPLPALESKACTGCHHDDHWLARGKLSLEQASSIHFLVERGLMPPPGFSLSEGERATILDFSRNGATPHRRR